ncbi:NHLP leader peptide family RiPP precursor [Coleofasciculus sp. F4-SAH-05]|uniref:NHLP leader peptide family RiPP precursor n=1 Tax=Coleofasciculus sp. F4-SAH-05 TaxID=3069525 RepID=UPI0040636E8C
MDNDISDGLTMIENDFDNFKDLEAQLIERAWQDEAFRQALLSNPKAVIEAEFGKKLPEDLQVTVLEETPNLIYIVLPTNPDELTDQDLSDEELDLVAGGSMFTVMGPNRLSLCIICPGDKKPT